MDKLQSWREDLGCKLWVNYLGMKLRGFRSHEENQTLPTPVGFSQHIMGVAFDVSSPNIEPENLYEQAIDFGWTGIGLYDTFVHIDIRNVPSGRTMTWENLRGR